MSHQTELGIVGLGHVYDWQAKALDLVDELHVVGGTDADRQKAPKLSRGQFFDSPDELLASDVSACLSPRRQRRTMTSPRGHCKPGKTFCSRNPRRWTMRSSQTYTPEPGLPTVCWSLRSTRLSQPTSAGS